MNNSPKPGNSKQKMFDIFKLTPKAKKADSKVISAEAPIEEIIDLTDTNSQPFDNHFKKLDEDLGSLIKIKEEEGKQPLLDILDELISKGSKDLNEKESSRTKPKKKYKPGPKFAKLKKKNNDSGSAEVSSPKTAESLPERDNELTSNDSSGFGQVIITNVSNSENTEKQFQLKHKEELILDHSCSVVAMETDDDVESAVRTKNNPELTAYLRKLSEIRDHIVGHETNEGSLICAYCPHKSKNADEFVTHLIEDHKNDIFQCNYCFHLTANSIRMIEHFKNSHPEKGKHNLTMKLKLVV